MPVVPVDNFFRSIAGEPAKLQTYKFNDAGIDHQVNQGCRDHDLPAEVHELIEAQPWKGPTHPNYNEDEYIRF